MLVSPERDYPLCAHSAAEKKIWMDSIRAVQREAVSLADGGGPVLVASSNSRLQLPRVQLPTAVSEGTPPPSSRRDDVDSSDEDEGDAPSTANGALDGVTATPVQYKDFSHASAAERQELRTRGGAETANKQGWLDKQKDKLKGWSKRYFVLSQHQLAYYREEPGLDTEARAVFDLTHFSIEAGDPAKMSFVVRSATDTVVLRADDLVDMTGWIKEVAKGIDIGKMAAAEAVQQVDLEDGDVEVARPDNSQIQPRGDVSKLLWSHAAGCVILVGRASIELIRPDPKDPARALRTQETIGIRQIGRANATITSCANNDEVIVLGLSDGRVMGVNVRRRSVSWQLACSRSEILSLCMDDDVDAGRTRLWCGGVDGAITLVMLDKASPDSQPRMSFSQSATPTPEWSPVVAIAVSEGLVWTATFGQVSVCVWDMSTRKCIQQVHCTFRVTALLSHGSEVWAGQGDGGITAFDSQTFEQVGSVVSNASEVKRLVTTGARVWSMHANGTIRVCSGTRDADDAGSSEHMSLLASFPAHNSIVDAVLVPINGLGLHMWSASNVGSLRVWEAGFPDSREQLVKKRMAARIGEYTETRSLKVRVVTHNVAEVSPSVEGNEALRDVWCGDGAKAALDEHRGFEDSHFEELHKWLEAHGCSKIEKVVAAFRAQNMEPESWLAELQAMEADGVLPDFLQAVEVQTEQTVQFDVIAIGLQEVEMTGRALAQGVAGLETKRGQDWRKHMDSILEQEGYVCAGGHQLVGLFCAVYVHRAHEKYMQDVHVKFIGCGLGGFAGNKGGIVVRLKLYETELNFVNTHLAAHMGHVSRRNKDFESIADALLPELVAVPPSRRVLSGEPLTMKATSPLIWFGDLNYRIPLEFEEVVGEIDEGKLDTIIAADQLVQEQAAQRAFVGFTESDIAFAPTYKFRMGAQHVTAEKPHGDYDRRIKKKSAAKGGGTKPPRVPAYTDRILWCGPGIRPLLPEPMAGHSLSYTSHPKITASDHKPVSHSLLIDAQRVIPAKRDTVREAVSQEVSVNATSAVPALQLSSRELDFGAARFGDATNSKVVAVTNTGSAPAHVHFEIVASGGSIRMEPPPWLRVSPRSGLIFPGSALRIQLAMRLDRDSSGAIPSSGILDVQLQLRCHDSSWALDGTTPVLPLRLHCRRVLGVVGLGLADLCLRPFPIRGDGVDQTAAAPAGARGAGRKAEAPESIVPDEYQALLDRLRSAPQQSALFLDEGDAEEIERLEELLETTGAIASFEGSPLSVAECLLGWLDQLPQPVVVDELQTDAFEATLAEGGS